MSKVAEFWQRFPVLFFVLTGALLYIGSTVAGDLGRLATYVYLDTPEPLERVQETVLAAAEDDLAKARGVVGASWPYACSLNPDSGKIDFEEASCANALNEKTPWPQTARKTMTALMALNLKVGELRLAAAGYDGDADRSAWSHFSGGRAVGKVADGRAMLAKLDVSGEDKDKIKPRQLMRLAAMSVALATSQADTAKGFEESLTGHAYRTFTRVATSAAFALLFFMVLGVAQAGLRRGGSTWRWLWALVVALSVAFVAAPDAFSSFDLRAAGEGKNSGGALLDAPAIVLSQIMHFVAQVFAGLFSAGAAARALMLGLFGLLFFRRTALGALFAIYALLLLPHWFDGSGWASSLVFSPFNPDAFEASVLLPLLVWLTDIAVVLLAALLSLGAWEVLGTAAVDRAEALMDEVVDEEEVA